MVMKATTPPTIPMMTESMLVRPLDCLGWAVGKVGLVVGRLVVGSKMISSSDSVGLVLGGEKVTSTVVVQSVVHHLVVQPQLHLAGVAVAVDGVGGQALQCDVTLVGLEVGDQLRSDGGYLAVPDIQPDVGGHRHGEEDQSGQVGNVCLLDGYVDGPTGDAIESTDGDVLNLIPGHPHTVQTGREGGGELVPHGGRRVLYLHCHGLQCVETFQNTFHINISHFGIAIHF